jgi:glycosyltransferase involved in cell wall biosynthesis
VDVPTPVIGRLEELAREADVVHLHDVAPFAVVPRLRDLAPVVASVHAYACCTPGTYYFEPGNECSRPHGPGCVPHMALRGCAHSRDPRDLPRRYRQTTLRRQGLASAHGLIAYSEAISRHLGNNGLGPIHRVRLFPETPLHVTPVPEDRRLLFVGRVVQAKGLDVLIDALEGLDATLDVHGDGWALPSARKRARRLGVEDRVQFHGWGDEATLRTAYERARAVVVPSLWPEPFGLVGLEAMAHARPTVATATGGIPEWLDDGRTGLLALPGDSSSLRHALRRVLDDHDLATSMGAAAAERLMSHFTAERHITDLEGAYISAAEAHAVLALA